MTSTSAATLALPDHRQGVTSGAVNIAAQIGTALGVAVLLSVAGAGAGAVGVQDRSTGCAVAFVVAGIVAAIYAVLLLLLSHRDRAPTEDAEPS